MRNGSFGKLLIRIAAQLSGRSSPTAGGFAVIFVCGLENGRSQDELQVKRGGTDISEAVRLAGRYDERLTGI